MTKIMDNMEKEMKKIQLLNLRQKLLNQIFVITQMHILLQLLMLHLKIVLRLQDV